MKHHFLLAGLFFFSSLLFAQEPLQWDWSNHSTSLNGRCMYDNSFIDSQGNTYVIGTFRSSIMHFSNLTVTQRFWKKDGGGICAGGCPDHHTADVFIAKINNSGSVVWLQSIEGWENEYGMAITANEAGESWCVIRTSSDTVVVDDLITEVDQSDGYGSENVLIKLDPSGNVDWTKLFHGEDNLAYTARLFHQNDQLIMVANFGVDNDGYVDVFSQSIPSTFNYNMNLFVKFDAETGGVLFVKGLGEKVGGGSFVSNVISSVQKIGDDYLLFGGTGGDGIKYDNQTLNFTPSGTSSNFYFARLDTTGFIQDLFEYEDGTSGHMVVNEEHIVVLSNALTHPDYEELLHVDYLTHQGDMAKSFTVPNEKMASVRFYIKGFTLTHDDLLVVPLTIYDGFEMNQETYSIPISEHTHPSDKKLTNQYGDPLLAVFNDSGQIMHVHHFVGRDLQDEIVGISYHDQRVRLITSQQSEEMYFGNMLITNNSGFGYDLFHHEPYGVHRYENLVFSQLDVNAPAVGTNPVVDLNLHVYPNPARSGDELQLGDGIDPKAVRLFDFRGRVLSQSEEQLISLPDDLNVGAYMLEVETEAGIYRQKVLVY